METAAKWPLRFYDRCGGPRGSLPGWPGQRNRSRSLAPERTLARGGIILAEGGSTGSTAGGAARVQNAQWEESSGCPAGAGSGAAARASVRQRSPSKPAAACAAHSAPTTPDSNALMMSAYATTQPTRLRHKGLLLVRLRCMESPPHLKLPCGRSWHKPWNRARQAAVDQRIIYWFFPASRMISRQTSNST